MASLAMTSGIRRDGTDRTGGDTTPPCRGGNRLCQQRRWRCGGRQSTSSTQCPQRTACRGHHDHHSLNPPVVFSPLQPLPILCVIVLFSLLYLLPSWLLLNRHSPSYSPPPPPLPLPSRHRLQSCLPIAASTAPQGMPAQITSLWRAALSTLPHCLVVRFDSNGMWESSCELDLAVDALIQGQTQLL